MCSAFLCVYLSGFMPGQCWGLHTGETGDPRFEAGAAVSLMHHPKVVLILQDELEAYFEEQQNEGVCFRRCLAFVIVGTVFFLLWLKWDREGIVADIASAKIEVVQKSFALCF